MVKDKEILEKVFKRAITMTSGLSGSNYDREAERGWFNLPGEQKKARRYEYYMDITMWTKTNSSALRIYQEKEEVYKPGSQVFL